MSEIAGVLEKQADDCYKKCKGACMVESSDTIKLYLHCNYCKKMKWDDKESKISKEERKQRLKKKQRKRRLKSQRKEGKRRKLLHTEIQERLR